MDIAPPGVLGPRLPCIFYRSTHSCTPGSTSLIKFYAVNHYARVFLDGKVAAVNTAGGYTPFQVQSSACAASGSREIAVVVANTQNATLSPTFTGGDFYFYSGIIRPVVVSELPTTTPYWIDRVEPVSTDYIKARVLAPRDLPLSRVIHSLALSLLPQGLIEVRVVFGGDVSEASSVKVRGSRMVLRIPRGCSIVLFLRFFPSSSGRSAWALTAQLPAPRPPSHLSMQQPC
jgi:hypothetical protein